MSIKSCVQEPKRIYYSSFLCLSLSSNLKICSYFLQIYCLFFCFPSLPPLCFPNWILCKKSSSPCSVSFDKYIALVPENLGFASCWVVCVSQERRAMLLFFLTVFNSCINSPYLLNSVSLCWQLGTETMSYDLRWWCGCGVNRVSLNFQN